MVAYSLFAASISAMNAQSLSFQNISDNISNSTTTGYKAGQVRFQEMVVSQAGSSSFSKFIGTQANQQVFRDREGVISGTQRRLDASLSGSGFFITSTALTPTDSTLELTDAGRFGETLVLNGADEEVYLTDIKGNFVLGWPFDVETGTYGVDTNSTTSLQPIRVDSNTATYDARATTEAMLSFNLPASAATGDTFSFDLPIYDGSGSDDGFNDAQQLITTFTKTATANVWDMTVSGTGGTVTTPAVQPVQVTFDANGNLDLVDGTAAAPFSVSVDWANSGITTPFTIDFRDSTQYGNASSQNDLRVNGNPEGSLNNVSLGANGNVIGTYSNGLTQPIARIAVGDVIEPNRLLSAGQTHFKLGPNSGELQLVDLATSSRVRFVPNALEESTTDLALEFSNMIMTQRAYSSAATSLRTVDEMVRTATELKS